MKTKNLFKTPTSKNLNEMLNAKFGEKLDIDNFSLVQLRKAKSLVENKLSKLQKTKFNENLKNDNYHRLKMMHDIIKTAISERTVNHSQVNENKLVRARDFTSIEHLTGPYYIGIYSDGYDQFPDLLQKVGDGDEFSNNFKDLGMIPSKRNSSTDEIKQNAMAMVKKMNPKITKESKQSNKRVIKEGEEGKAELIMAIKDMVDRFTGWSEDIAQMQAQTSMELADAIRDEVGAEVADQFSQSASPVLDSAFEAVKQAREALSNAITLLTGESMEPMGEPAMDEPTDAEPEMDLDDGDMDIDPDASGEGDEGDVGIDLGADEEPDRAKRESIERRLRISRILAS